MSYDDLTREQLVRLVERLAEQVDTQRESIAHYQQAAAAHGLVERAALALWGHAMSDMLLLSTLDRRMAEEVVAEIAARCWYVGEIFARGAGLPHAPQKKGGV